MSSEEKTMAELNSAVATLQASAEETKKEEEELKAKIKSADEQNKTKDEEMNAAIKLAEDESNKKLEKKIAAIKKASEETDKQKRKDAMKKANDDLEKKVTEQKAQIDSLTKEIALPKLTYLANIYKDSSITELAFKELSASWSGMSITELDAEITKVQPFVDTEHNASKVDVPIAPSKSLFEFTASSSKKTGTESIDAKSDLDLFNKGDPYN